MPINQLETNLSEITTTIAYLEKKGMHWPKTFK